jgi:hypothetical protein
MLSLSYVETWGGGRESWTFAGRRVAPGKTSETADPGTKTGDAVY